MKFFLLFTLLVLFVGIVSAQDPNPAPAFGAESAETQPIFPIVEDSDSDLSLDSGNLDQSKPNQITTTTSRTIVVVPPQSSTIEEPTTRRTLISRLSQGFTNLRAGASRSYQRFGELRRGLHVDPESLAYRTGRRISLTLQSLFNRSRALARQFVVRQGERIQARQEQQQRAQQERQKSQNDIPQV